MFYSSAICSTAVVKVYQVTHAHQQGMAVVDRVPELESEDGVGPDVRKLGSELSRGQPEVVEAVVPTDAVENFDVAANKPVAGSHHHLEAQKNDGNEQFSN